MTILHSIMLRCKPMFRPMLRAIGLDVIPYDPRVWGESIEQDIAKLIAAKEPVVFDVGSNTGQSVLAFRKLLPQSKIHCFEPGRSTFRQLEETAKTLGDVTLNNFAVGQVSENREFYEYDQSVMNSLHKPGDQNWSQPTVAYPIEVVTLDDYSKTAGVPRIDLLKVDTQGHDMDVVLGAMNLIKSASVRLIMCEIIFTRLYEDQPSPYQFLELLSQNGYRLVSFYNIFHSSGEIGWCDVLFVHGSVLQDKSGV